MTHRIRPPFVSLLLAGLLAACGGDPHEAVVEDMIDVQNDIASLLEGFHTRGDVQAARGELEDLGKRMTDIGERLEKLEDPKDPQSAQKMLVKMGPRMEEAQTRMMTAMQRVMQDPALKDEFAKVMSEVDFGR